MKKSFLIMANIKSFSKYLRACAIITAITTLISGCNNNTSAQQMGTSTLTTIDTNKFSIATPDGWQRHIKTSNGFSILYLMAPRVDNFNPNINILTESTRGASFGQYFEKSIENMKNANFKEEGSGDFNANGVRGKYALSTYNPQGHNMAIKSYIFFKGDVAYVITGTCLVTQKDIYRPIFDKTVQTFTLK